MAVAMSQVSSIQPIRWTPLPCYVSKFVDNGAGVLQRPADYSPERSARILSSWRKLLNMEFGFQKSGFKSLIFANVV